MITVPVPVPEAALHRRGDFRLAAVEGETRLKEDLHPAERQAVCIIIHALWLFLNLEACS